MSATIDCPPNTALRIDARTSQADGPNTVTVFLNGNQAMVARFSGRYFTGQPMADAANYTTGQAGIELACVNPDGTPTAVAAVPSEAATAGPPLPAVAAGSLPFTGDHTGALLGLGASLVVLGVMLVRAARRRPAAAYQPSTSSAWD